LEWGALRCTAQVVRQGEWAHIFTPQGATQILVPDALSHAGESEGEGGRLSAPMPGKIVSFAVQVNDVVKKGQVLAVMEAMKMEHTIAAPADGKVSELLYAAGDQVAEGAELLRLAAD
jgi:3-methylcrotonyl-CoA carboxylase alpha subunit